MRGAHSGAEARMSRCVLGPSSDGQMGRVSSVPGQESPAERVKQYKGPQASCSFGAPYLLSAGGLASGQGPGALMGQEQWKRDMEVPGSGTQEGRSSQ